MRRKHQWEDGEGREGAGQEWSRQRHSWRAFATTTCSRGSGAASLGSEAAAESGGSSEARVGAGSESTPLDFLLTGDPDFPEGILILEKTAKQSENMCSRFQVQGYDGCLLDERILAEILHSWGSPPWSSFWLRLFAQIATPFCSLMVWISLSCGRHLACNQYLVWRWDFEEAAVAVKWSWNLFSEHLKAQLHAKTKSKPTLTMDQALFRSLCFLHFLCSAFFVEQENDQKVDSRRGRRIHVYWIPVIYQAALSSVHVSSRPIVTETPTPWSGNYSSDEITEIPGVRGVCPGSWHKWQTEFKFSLSLAPKPWVLALSRMFCFR